MKENTDNSYYFSEKVKNELHLYKQYLEYSKDKKINIGNKNWLIIDSSKTRYLKIIKELEMYNEDDPICIRKIIDYDFLEKKGINEQKMLNAFFPNDDYTNVLVISDISEKLALNKYGSKCAFFANLDTEVTYDNKKQIIKFLFKDNHFKTNNKRTFEQLLDLSVEEVEKVLARAFTMALNDQTNIISNKYLSYQKSGLKSNLRALETLIGLDEVKSTLQEIINYISVSQKRKNDICTNMLFLGNPGTGKTTVAKIVGDILSSIGFLNSNAPFIFTSREQLIGQYIGDAEKNTLDTVNSAIGGVLFIDEAYSLIGSDSDRDFGYRVVDVLVNQMDIHKNDICFIFAGYKKEMLEFIKSNPGLESRLPFKLEFKDYSQMELYSILRNFMKQDKLRLSPNCEQILLEHFAEAKNQVNFGNGRYIRNFYERLKIKQANRISKEQDSNIYLIKKVDIENTIKSLQFTTKPRLGFHL